MDHLEEFGIPEQVLSKLRDNNWVGEQLREGKTFQDMLNFSDSTMDQFYSKARHLFQIQRYEDASNAFVFLTTLNPYHYAYWIGLGMSDHLLQEYENALIAYAMASLCDPENPFPHYHAAACYQLTNDRENALLALEMVIRCCGNTFGFADMKSKAISAKSMLLKK